tara:strand:+ start:230 stop:655 length:426 start_codon:yes stop_codon:yes gene_type:complete
MNITKEIIKFNFEFDLDLFKHTRKREYVEARAVFYYYLHTYCRMRLTDIVNEVAKETGWKPNHATILHAIKNYPVYVRFNKDLETRFLGYLDSVGGRNNRVAFIQNALLKLNEDKIDAVYDIVQTAYEEVRAKQVEVIKEI